MKMDNDYIKELIKKDLERLIERLEKEYKGVIKTGLTEEKEKEIKLLRQVILERKRYLQERSSY